MRKSILNLLAGAVLPLSLIAVSCGTKNDPDTPDTTVLTVSENGSEVKRIDVPIEAGNKTLTLNTEGAVASTDADWLKATLSGTSLTVAWGANESTERSAHVFLSKGTAKTSLTVNQEGKAAATKIPVAYTVRQGWSEGAEMMVFNIAKTELDKVGKDNVLVVEHTADFGDEGSVIFRSGKFANLAESPTITEAGRFGLVLDEEMLGKIDADVDGNGVALVVCIWHPLKENVVKEIYGIENDGTFKNEPVVQPEEPEEEDYDPSNIIFSASVYNGTLMCSVSGGQTKHIGVGEKVAIDFANSTYSAASVRNSVGAVKFTDLTIKDNSAVFEWTEDMAAEDGILIIVQDAGDNTVNKVYIYKDEADLAYESFPYGTTLIATISGEELSKIPSGGVLALDFANDTYSAAAVRDGANNTLVSFSIVNGQAEVVWTADIAEKAKEGVRLIIQDAEGNSVSRVFVAQVVELGEPTNYGQWMYMPPVPAAGTTMVALAEGEGSITLRDGSATAFGNADGYAFANGRVAILWTEEMVNAASAGGYYMMFSPVTLSLLILR